MLGVLAAPLSKTLFDPVMLFSRVVDVIVLAGCEPFSGLCLIGLPLPQLINELALCVHWAFAVLRFGVILDGYLALLLAKKASACLSRL